MMGARLLFGELHEPICQRPYKLVDQCVDLPVRGLDQAACQGGLFVRRADLGELFMQGGHLFHQGDHAVVAGEVGWIGAEWGRLKIQDQETDIHPKDYDFHHKGTKLTKNAQRRLNKNIS